MSSGLHTYQKLTLVHGKSSGTSISCYDNHVSMVCDVLNSGALADGCHSSPAHIDALRLVAARLEKILTEAIETNRRDDEEEQRERGGR